MAEIIKSAPVQTIIGLCQTSNRRHVDFTKDIARIKVTNTGGQLVDAVTFARNCTIKSRSEYRRDHAGMGVDYELWEDLHRKARYAMKHGLPMPRIPKGQGALWAEEIQAETDVGIAMETMDPMHAMMFYGIIQPGRGMRWSPSVLQDGEVVQGIAEISAEDGLFMGAKGPKWDPRRLPLQEADTKPSSNEKTQLGIATYALLSMDNPSPYYYPIERGSDSVDNDPRDGTPAWRNRSSHQRARITKQMINDMIRKHGLKTEVVMTYDVSHSNGPKRVDRMLDDAEEAVQEKDLEGNELYGAIMAEVAEADNLPLSDADQALIGGEAVQELTDRIGKHRTIFDRRNLSNK